MEINEDLHAKNAAEFHIEQDDVFGRIANRYDLLSDLFSLGIHRLWKRKVAEVIIQDSLAQLLDCATGTGDIILRVVKRKEFQQSRNILASDISPQMLNIARKKLSPLKASIALCILDAHAIPAISSNSIDLYSISLGLKICEREKVLQEALRVLRPGGKFVSLEASNIIWGWLHQVYLLYMRLCMPIIGWLATGGDTSAYRYLLKGIEEFPTAEALAKELADIGFGNVSFKRLSLGIVAIHVAYKPLMN